MTPDAIPPGADGGSAERQRRLKRRLGSTFVLVGLLLVAANLRASITSVGPVIDRIQQDLALTSAAAAALTSLPLIAFALVSPIAARIANQLGLERVLGLSVGLLAVGILVRSAEPTWLIWIGTAILGVAIAVLNVVLPALVKRDFPTKIGLVTGAYTAVQSGFAAIAAGVAVPVANVSEYGWRAAIGIWSALALLALLVFAPQMTRRTVVLAPQSYPLVTKVSPWRRSIAWQVTIFMGLQSLAFYVLTAWLAPIELSAGLSAATAGVHQALMNVGSLVGSLVCSVLIHRLRDHRPIALGTGLSMATAFAGILLAPEGTAVWASLAGVSSGMSLVLSLSFFGLRTRHHLTAASLSAMAQCIGYVIAALGPLTIGAIHDVTGSWTSPLLLLIGIALVQSAVGVLDRAEPVLGLIPSGVRVGARRDARALSAGGFRGHELSRLRRMRRSRWATWPQRLGGATSAIATVVASSRLNLSVQSRSSTVPAQAPWQRVERRVPYWVVQRARFAR